MPLPGKGLLRRLPVKPPLSPKHREEQIKFGNWGKTPGTQLQQNKGRSGSVTLLP